MSRIIDQKNDILIALDLLKKTQINQIYLDHMYGLIVKKLFKSNYYLKTINKINSKLKNL